MDGLKFLLEDKISQAGLLLQLVDCLVELFKQLFLFTLKVLILLQTHFKLPLYIFQNRVTLHYIVLGLSKHLHDGIMLNLLLGEYLDLLAGLGEWLHDLLVGLLLVQLLLLHHGVFLTSIAQFILQLLDNVQVRIRYLLVISLDVLIFLFMFPSQLFDCLILLELDHLNGSFPLFLHVFSQ